MPVSPIKVEQTKEQPQSNEIKESSSTQVLNTPNEQASGFTSTQVLTNTNEQVSAFASTQILSNTKEQTSGFTSIDQRTMAPFNSSASVPYYPLSTTSMQNSSAPAFQIVNTQYSPPQLGSVSETVKPFVLTPHVTHLPSFTTQEQELKNINASQEPTMTVVPPSQQPSTTHELTYQMSTTLLPQNSYSQYHHPSNTGGGITIATDVPSSKEISNYFTQYQTQSNPSNDSSTIPMFSVKNFPQMSLAQPLGK